MFGQNCNRLDEGASATLFTIDFFFLLLAANCLNIGLLFWKIIEKRPIAPLYFHTQNRQKLSKTGVSFLP